MLDLYKKIRARREELNMSQDELAKKLGYKSRSSINKIEKGENDIPQSKIVAFARALDTSPETLMGWGKHANSPATPAPIAPTRRQGIRIPVLGRVVAGIPIEAITDIFDYEEIDPDLAKTGDFFALHVQGSSMEPKLYDGDVVIVRRQPTVESGETAIVLVNGNDATVKQVKEVDAGIMLIGHNTAVYEPHFYSQQEISDLPVQILGKVVELRRKF